MRKATLVATVLAALAVAAVLHARSQQNTEPKPNPSFQPAWVRASAASMRKMFLGNPQPKSVGYHQGRKSASVTITFRESAVCGVCMRPAGAAPPSGRVATTSVDARTHRALGFSLKD